ncbi:MAG: response regulator transcription factor [Protaetiibacter sp.]
MSTQTTAPTALTRPDGTPVRALVVDDEPSLAELIQMALRYEGWQVETATDGATALSKARAFQPDIIVLDIMMPGLDGLEVLRRLRASGDDVAVLFLTAKDAVMDRVIGLTAGGDDYVTKPFSLEEVVARLRALLRRTGRAVTGYTDPVLRVGDLTLDEESYEVSRAGKPIELTAKEFELLRYLMRNPRRVVSKLQILDRVWSYDFEGRSSIVEIYISYLRKKIDIDGMPPLIHTVRGVGYLIKPAT